MSLTVQSLPIRVRALLAARGQDVSNLRSNRILALVPTALQMLARMVMNSPDPAKRHLLRKTFDITSTDGEVSLTTPLTASEPLLLDGLKKATITFDGQAYPAQYKADRSSMMFTATEEFIYWTLENTTILIADSNGLGSFDGDGEIRNAPYVPSLTNVQVQSTLDMDLVTIIADLASVKGQAVA